jgi:hypothetical protein
MNALMSSIEVSFHLQWIDKQIDLARYGLLSRPDSTSHILSAEPARYISRALHCTNMGT